MNKVAIRCSGLSRYYGDVKALDQLDLEVHQGSIFGFLGRNGAGKTTTIRLITGLGKPTSGEAWVSGAKTTNGVAAARNSFGYLPEEPAFYSWMTPVEFLGYIGQLFGLDSHTLPVRIAELLGRTGLEGAANRRIGGFSKGMRQRLGIAQALLHNPDVLFLDEPTSALDPAGRRDALDLLAELRGDTTVFLSSHILADVENICDTIGIIQKGRLLLVAERDDLLSQHARNVFVMEFKEPSKSSLERLTELVKGQAWVEQVHKQDDRLRVMVRDLAQGQRELLGYIAKSDLFLVRYEWQRPTLEDVFLKISAT